LREPRVPHRRRDPIVMLFAAVHESVLDGVALLDVRGAAPIRRRSVAQQKRRERATNVNNGLNVRIPDVLMSI